MSAMFVALSKFVRMYLQSPRPCIHCVLKYWFKSASAQVSFGFFCFSPKDKVRVIRDEPQRGVKRSSF